MKCPKCNYEWLIRTANPKRCPRCMYRLERSKDTIIVVSPLQEGNGNAEAILINGNDNVHHDDETKPIEQPKKVFKTSFKLEGLD